jgi:hypothetical protein
LLRGNDSQTYPQAGKSSEKLARKGATGKPVRTACDQRRLRNVPPPCRKGASRGGLMATDGSFFDLFTVLRDERIIP